jgi:hypothetical protein
MIRLAVMTLLCVAAMRAHAQVDLSACTAACDACLTVTEPVLLEPSDTWGRLRPLQGAEADSLLRFLQIIDSTGAVPSGTTIATIRRCSVNASVQLITYYVDGTYGTHDESIYAVTEVDGVRTGQICIGILKADCSPCRTMVRCAWQNSGTPSTARPTISCLPKPSTTRSFACVPTVRSKPCSDAVTFSPFGCHYF